MLRLFSLGVLAAAISLLIELLLFSVFEEKSLVLLALAIPLIEESTKFVLLFKAKDFLPQRFSPSFFSAAGAFGLGFALPESILSESANLMVSPISFGMAMSIHLISAFFLASAILFLTKKNLLSTFSLFVFSLAIHALYNFLIFIQ
ncbi:MAG: hypothetical protein WAU28_03895 [Candidatus Moraniibacteriota bacterium]